MVEISQTTIYILWTAVIIIFGVFEAVTVQLVSIWFVIGAIAALIASLFGAGFVAQIIIFVVVSVLALVITRPLFKKYIRPKMQPTNADKVLNQVGIVVEDINNLSATGQVKVDGKIWTARTIDNSLISKDKKVIIEKIEGVKLIVKNIEKGEN